MSDDQWPAYRFKWANLTLRQYVLGRKAVADRLYREAEILKRRAEQIAEECDELERSLEDVPDAQ